MLYIPQEFLGGGGPMDSFEKFVNILRKEMNGLSEELNSDSFIIPIGLFFILDESQGGDPEALNLIKKYKFLNEETSNFIDFYFIGWDLEKGTFDIDASNFIRRSLKKNDINLSFCNAELIIVDAIFRDGVTTLDFTRAIPLNIDSLIEKKVFPSLVAFINALIQICKQLRQNPEAVSNIGTTWSISDKLGIMIAKESLLDLILKRFGNIIRADKIVNFQIKPVGPKIDLSRI